jgi:hypothetical protein
MVLISRYRLFAPFCVGDGGRKVAENFARRAMGIHLYLVHLPSGPILDLILTLRAILRYDLIGRMH